MKKVLLIQFARRVKVRFEINWNVVVELREEVMNKIDVVSRIEGTNAIELNKYYRGLPQKVIVTFFLSMDGQSF